MATSSSQQPALPPGLKYYQSAVEELLLGSQYLDTFVTSRRGAKNVALPLPGSSNPSDITGLQIFGQAQPLSIKTMVVNGGLRGAATLGSSRSGMSLRWVLASDDEFALPYKQPLPTLFDARGSQRFNMMDVEFRLDEDGKNAFQGFGAGRTYPVDVAGEAWLGACGKIMSGTGVFANVQGSFVLNGRITPPDGVAFEMLIRVLVFASGQPPAGPPGLKGVSAANLGATSPLAGSTYLTFLGAPDPTTPLRQDIQSDGTVTGASVAEILRPVRVEYSLGNDGKSLRAHYAPEDWIAGRLTTQIRFTLNPSDPPPPDNSLSPLPWYTEGTTITFFDPKGKELGTIAANIAEGRGFSTQFAGFPGPILNLVGFGPFAGGTGSFAGARGMLSVNAGVSVDPATLSNLYVLRLAHSKGR